MLPHAKSEPESESGEEGRKPVNLKTWQPLTMPNLITMAPSSTRSTTNLAMGHLKAGPSMTYYSERIVEDILTEMFAERRGHFTETSSACDLSEQLKPSPEPYVDKRLKYWRDMLQKRRGIQQRVQQQTGKRPEQVLFNRRSTLDNRNKETVRRLMDYAERLQPEKLGAKPVDQLKELIDPCTYECLHEGVPETWPKAELEGKTKVEIIGLPQVIKEELLGAEAAKEELKHGWMDSKVLDERIGKHFKDITKVVEFFPDLDGLQVTGINIEKLRPKPVSVLIGEDKFGEITTSNSHLCSEDEMSECWHDITTQETEQEVVEPEPELPELALKVNGKQFIVCEEPFTDCYELLTKFKCDPFQRRAKLVLQLTNIGKQTLSFNWKQGIYYYNRATLLLAKDNEFLFDTDSFRLSSGQSYNLKVLYQPRKVNMSVELWQLHVEPRIFCGKQESLVLRFHGCCTAPKEYMARLDELKCAALCKSNMTDYRELTGRLGSLVPLIEPPPACCPYERPLDERELFNSLNPGYNCMRFDDLEVLKGMHMHLKKPREPPWDLRLETIKMLIMRIENLQSREKTFANYMIILTPLQGVSPSLESICEIDIQKQRTRLIYVRGVICNGIEEWEDIMFTLGESFFKSELQNYFVKQMEEDLDEGEEEDDDEGGRENKKNMKLFAAGTIEPDEPLSEEKIQAEVFKNLRHSKFFRDALYLQTYSHLCDIAENIVSIIESTDVVPT